MPEGSASPAGRPARVALLVGALVVLALALRLPTAGEQSFWLDEVYTGRIVDGSLGHAWSTIQRTENTPPLFYLLDWAWGRAFGTGELALRSLSALAGALAIVPVVALGRLVGAGGPTTGGTGGARASEPADPPDAASRPGADRLDRAALAVAGALRRPAVPGGTAAPVGVALAAGALLAVNPLAQWFSQEARSYALLVLLSAAAWAALLSAAERPTPRRLRLWALVAAAAAWTHYFGGLLFAVGWATLGLVAVAGAPGARLRALRPLAVPAALSAVAVAALLPIARNQQSTDMYQAISQVKGLPARIVELPKQFAVGYNAPAEYVVGGALMIVLAVLVLAAAWPRDGRPTRATALLGVVAVVWALPLVALAGGFDVVLTRNFVLLIPPLTVLAALGAWRIGRPALLALGAVGVVQVATIAVVALTPIYQREDWRGLIRATADGIPGPEAVFVGAYQEPAATYYAPTLRPLPVAPLVVRSVALVDRLDPGTAMERVPVPPAPPGFTLARAEQRDQWHVFVWTAPVPTAVAPGLVGQWQTTPPRTPLLRP